MIHFILHHLSFILSQSMPSAAGLSFWLSAAGNVALILTVIVMVARKNEGRTISPQPLVVEESIRTVNERDCLSRHDQSTQQINALASQLAELRCLRIQDSKDSSASREKMYAAIKDVRLEVTNIHEATRREMSVGFQDIERALGRLEGKINRHT